MSRYASHDCLLLIRNLGYGGLAACLVILVGLTEVGAKDTGLQVSVYSASRALPIWLLIGVIYEPYIFLRKQRYQHLKTKFFTSLASFCLVVASLGMIAAAAGIIWYLVPEAVYVFDVSVLIAVFPSAIFHVN